MQNRLGRVLLVVPLTARLWAQISAPGDGADLYSAFGGSIYKIGTQLLTLVFSVPTPVVPPRPSYAYELPEGAYYVSPYYVLQGPQLSRDSSVLAYTASRICLGGLRCAELVAPFGATYQSSVLAPGMDAQTLDGTCWLSRNGRYLLCDSNRGRAYFVDLATGQQTPEIVGDLAGTPGRRIADNGTAVIGGVNGAPVYLSRFGQTLATIPGAAGASIDAQGTTVVFTNVLGLHVFNTERNQDTYIPFQFADLPSVSADGKRILFLTFGSFTGAVHQLYEVNADGTGLKNLTSSLEPGGVVSYALSDDGRVAWYTIGDGRFVKLDLNSGQPLATFRPPMVDLAPVLVPGSAVILPGSRLPIEPGSVQVTVGGIIAPLLDVSATRITFQVPWEVPAEQPVPIQVAVGDSTVQGSVTPVVSRPVILPSPTSQDFGAIHEDWSGYVTLNSPAAGGEIVHFVGAGFGPVVDQPTTGTAPDIPVSVLGSPLNCNATILYAGLAPGRPGYYQLDIQLPDTIPYPGFDLQCAAEARAFVP